MVEPAKYIEITRYYMPMLINDLKYVSKSRLELI
jgi:hypothetical protein